MLASLIPRILQHRLRPSWWLSALSSTQSLIQIEAVLAGLQSVRAAAHNTVEYPASLWRDTRIDSSRPRQHDLDQLPAPQSESAISANIASESVQAEVA